MNTNADQQIDALINRHEASWRLGYDVFPAVLDRLGLKRGAEIGVAFGGHSEAILQSTGVTKLYAIDSYKHRPEYDDPMNLPQPVFDRLFERTGQRLSSFGDRVIQIRLDSVEAAQQITEPLDFVYIDGDHSYEGIRADLEAWFPLIREGGIVAGHDYGQPAFPGVKAAADHFFQRFALTITHEGKGIWWAHRPATPLTVVLTTADHTFCDAGVYTRLKAAGLTEQDRIILVHDSAQPCDAVTRVLWDHPNVSVQPVAEVRGPWHNLMAVLDQVSTPLLLTMDIQQPLGKGTLTTLRNRLCNSGAMAAAYTDGPGTNDFALADLLATATPPTEPGQMMWMTLAAKQAKAAIAGMQAAASDRLIPWLMMNSALGLGGRIALGTGQTTNTPRAWSATDCRLASEALMDHAPLIDGTDLLRLKWPTTASHWLNQLANKPVRTRINVAPVDTPRTYNSLRTLDRVVHKVRRAMKGAA